MPSTTPLLEVDDLHVEFSTPDGKARVINGATFKVFEGETLGLVGESGSGKSLTALATLRLITPPGRITGGRILLRGSDLLKVSEPEIRKVRGKEISLIFQEPVAALNPVFTVGDQIVEAIRVHNRVSKKEALQQAVGLLRMVQIPDPERRVHEYPHQMSGGMCQRVMIAMALSCKPSLLIADEPTTALDVTIQAEILDLLKRLKGEFGLSVLLISHNLGVIAGSADRVAVMYAGRIVEEAPTRTLFRDPRHPYTRGLLASLPGPHGTPLRAIEGTVPRLGHIPVGCAFAPRCPDRIEPCADLPALAPGADNGRPVRCFLHHRVHETATPAAPAAV